MNYTSTFPLLINLNNKPTYLVSLKDNAGLVKMYAFIDVQDYQKVVVTDASEGINKAALNYLQRYGENTKDSNIVTEKEIVVKNITSSVKDGNTWYYITDTNGKKYKAKITLSDNLPFISNGDKVKVYFLEDKEIIEITDIK
jgi:translation elongation factor P/translation initiation factor 5A